MIALPDAASPLYARVKDLILRNIADGTWPRDRRLPSEHDLVASTGVSRMTVHRAIRELTAAGVLTRVQGVGTFVAVPRARSGLVEIRDIAAEIAARGHRHGGRVLAQDRVAAAGDLADQFGFAASSPVFHSIVVHLEDDVPVQHEERFVNPLVAPAYGDQDFSRRTAFDYLMEVAPMTEFEHVISAVAAEPEIAGRLAIAPGSPCLLVQRRTWSGTVVATVNLLTYAGERIALATRQKAGN